MEEPQLKQKKEVTFEKSKTGTRELSSLLDDIRTGAVVVVDDVSSSCSSKFLQEKQTKENEREVAATPRDEGLCLCEKKKKKERQ